MIVFTPSYNTPLHRVSENGGESTPVTEFDDERMDNSHRHRDFSPTATTSSTWRGPRREHMKGRQ